MCGDVFFLFFLIQITAVPNVHKLGSGWTTAEGKRLIKYVVFTSK